MASVGLLLIYSGVTETDLYTSTFAVCIDLLFMEQPHEEGERLNVWGQLGNTGKKLL